MLLPVHNEFAAMLSYPTILMCTFTREMHFIETIATHFIFIVIHQLFHKPGAGSRS